MNHAVPARLAAPVVAHAPAWGAAPLLARAAIAPAPLVAAAPAWGYQAAW